MEHLLQGLHGVDAPDSPHQLAKPELSKQGVCALHVSLAMEWFITDFPYPRVARGGRIRRHEIMVIREKAESQHPHLHYSRPLFKLNTPLY